MNRRFSLVVAWTIAILALFARPGLTQDTTTDPIAALGSVGPVTVITDAMIEASGARSLKDLLVAYVPGMSFSQDHNEVTVAMRGVYASSQQKILLLVNGHILNSRSYVAANPDASINLDNIKRIDVLRGPASSVLGQGALAAVVSIVTKSAADFDGTMASVGVGSAGQMKASALFGAGTSRGADVFTWGTFYRSEGQDVDVPVSEDYSRVQRGGTAILDGFRGPPSHDVGLSLKTNAFAVFAAHRYSHYIEPFTSGGPTGEVYEFDDYQAGHGVEPGLGMGSFNLGISHERAIAGSTLFVRGYVDRMEVVAHVVSDPTVRAHSLVEWKDWDAGVIGRLSRPYSTSVGSGRWTAGMQVEAMRVDDSVLSTGTLGAWTTTQPRGALLDIGGEDTESWFAQFAHTLNTSWAANAGIRFDLKNRHEGDDVHVLSPHLAAVYTHDSRTNVMLSYGKGFVDAPYWYRYNSLPSYQGSRDLRPEFLHSFQITPTTTVTEGITARTTVFFNKLDKVVGRNKTAGPGEPTYQNAGFLKSWGLEPELRYARGRLTVDANLTYQRVMSSENYDVTGSEINNVPSWAWNAVVTFKPTQTERHDLLLNATTRFIGKQRSPVNIVIGSVTFIEPEKTVDRAVVIDLGARADPLWSTKWFADARLFNAFDADYDQGGSVAHPYPQAGRSALLTVGRRF